MKGSIHQLKQLVICGAIALLLASCNYLPAMDYNPWQQVKLPTEVTLLDLDFIDDRRGWIVGTRATLLETLDGGDTWQSKSLDLGDEGKYSFLSVSFAGEEGWVVGEPSILLHSPDAGETWERVPLSEKLPGSPYGIYAFGDRRAEMVTNVGAIYRTEDGGQTWHALVEEAVGVARNIARSSDGKYVAVSARGNFYSTWEPGQKAWQPHERNSSRRVQNMGFGRDGRLWMLARGGQIQFSDPQDYEVWEQAQYPEFSTSWGLLDVAYRTREEIWLAGGSGNLLFSDDGGQTWQKDREIENVPANLYRIIFLGSERGFILGNRGVLLKYEPTAPETAPAA